ncbi:kinase-like domain-containing protein [Rhodocollybia butyracea]|uniref:Kinase-like domain-containing protein n=1 Tax=Rhodocollybia butyracea TaxID=206335 RepID=A0A9P5PKT6_9AGAR|nr:kinase-like domain-containing protein [Rhodocollybia butyracea]
MITPSTLFLRLKQLLNQLKLRFYLLFTHPVKPLEPKIYRFRFGIPLILKRGRLLSSEADALGFLNRAAPHLPIPKLIDSFQTDDATYTVTTWLPGSPLLDWNDFSEEDMVVIAQDILDVLSQLWRIPQPTSLSGKVMTSASGHGLPHPATFNEKIGGPYDSTLHCYRGLVNGDLDVLATTCPDTVNAVLEDRIVWVHTDLRMQNILICNGRVSGIVDWEDSGWLPRHWQLHILRTPQQGCQGPWVRYWLWTHHFENDVETAYAASREKDMLLYRL